MKRRARKYKFIDIKKSVVKFKIGYSVLWLISLVSLYFLFLSLANKERKSVYYYLINIFSHFSRIGFLRALFLLKCVRYFYEIRYELYSLVTVMDSAGNALMIKFGELEMSYVHIFWISLVKISSFVFLYFLFLRGFDKADNVTDVFGTDVGSGETRYSNLDRFFKKNGRDDHDWRNNRFGIGNGDEEEKEVG